MHEIAVTNYIITVKYKKNILFFIIISLRASQLTPAHTVLLQRGQLHPAPEMKLP